MNDFSSVKIPKSLWNLKDRDGKPFLLELHVDLQGLLFHVGLKALKNRGRKVRLYSGLIRGRIIEKKGEI